VQPILFWTIGVLSLLAALAVVSLPRPQHAVVALVILMGLDAVELFLLQAPLLAVETIVVASGAVLLVWSVLVRRRRARLGVPGRRRYNVTKLLSFFVVLALGLVLVDVVLQAAEPQPRAGSDVTMVTGALLSLVLLLIAGPVTWWILRRARSSEEGEQA